MKQFAVDEYSLKAGNPSFMPWDIWRDDVLMDKIRPISGNWYDKLFAIGVILMEVRNGEV